MGRQRRLPIAVREPVDIDPLAQRLLAVVARLRAALPTDPLERTEIEFLTSMTEALVKSILSADVGEAVLVRELKWLLYSTEGPFEKRIREVPRQIPTHIAFRQAIERELREAPPR